MANKRRGEVEVDIGERLRVLRIDTEAAAALEDEYDKPLFEIFSGAPGLKHIRDGLFFGLRGRESRLTPAQVSKWIDAELEREGTKAIERLALAIAKAVASYFGLDLDKSASPEDGAEAPFENTKPEVPAS